MNANSLSPLPHFLWAVYKMSNELSSTDRHLSMDIARGLLEAASDKNLRLQIVKWKLGTRRNGVRVCC